MMNKTLWFVLAGMAVFGCKKQEQAQTPSPGSTTSPVTSPASAPVIVDPKTQDAQLYRAAAEHLFSEWQGGTFPPDLQDLTSVFVGRAILLDFKIVSFKRAENDVTHSFVYLGTVNLQLQTQEGQPATKQFSIRVDKHDGKYTVDLMGR